MLNYDEEIERLAMNPHEFSPVVVSGNSGNGKSRFLEKFCKRRRELYEPSFSKWKNGEYMRIIKSEELIESIEKSISANNKSWRKKFIDDDVIVIDDFDLFVGKLGIQEELFSYFIVCNKGIVIATSAKIRRPHFIARLSSFFSTGVHIHIEDPDKVLKLDFLTYQLAINNLFVDEDALFWLTNQNFASFAAIKGFIKTLRFFKTDRSYTLEDCKRLVKDYIS